MRIKIKTQSGVTVWLHAETFAQSAAENNLDVTSFKASMDKFSNESESSIEDIQKWRDEATDKYFSLVKLPKVDYREVLSGSGEDEDDPSVSNIKN